MKKKNNKDWQLTKLGIGLILIGIGIYVISYGILEFYIIFKTMMC